MNIHVDCIPCFLRQALETVARVTADEAVHWRVVKAISALASDVGPCESPPQFAERAYDAVAAITGVADPFVAQKREANDLVHSIAPRLRKALTSSQDPLLAAVKLSIAGNSMDLGVVRRYGDVGALADSMLAAPLGVDDYARFRQSLMQARHVLMVGDNNGEVVLDKMLIEQMRLLRDCHYTYVVRGRPIINDVTRADALSVGMQEVADIVDTGSGMPGLVLSASSVAVRELFFAADMVVAKGQGNYEGLSDAPRDVFFLSMVKCPVISRHLDAPVGVAAVKHHRPA